ncbi:MAG: TrkA C-terminal domain-containing protein [Planctomycetota bacterium]
MTGIASLIALLVIMTISMTIVKIGAIMLRMTGLDDATAGFQALSAFTGTGFTTQASEMIVRHESRRRVIRWLMILGNAGMAVGVASLLGFFTTKIAAEGSDFLDVITRYIILIASCVLYIALLVNKSINRRLDKYIAKRLSRYENLQYDELEHLLSIGKDASIVSLEVNDKHPIASRSLRNLGLPKYGILVLSVHRDNTITAIPDADFVILPGDRVVCFGRVDTMRVLLAGFDESDTNGDMSLSRLFEGVKPGAPLNDETYEVE